MRDPSACDVKVFNPHAPSNRNSNLDSCYRRHERLKRIHSYEQRIREVEHASFTPLVFSATGGLGNEAKTFYKRLASLLVSKWDNLYSSMMAWLRCRLTLILTAEILNQMHQGSLLTFRLSCQSSTSGSGEGGSQPHAQQLNSLRLKFIAFAIFLLFYYYNYLLNPNKSLLVLYQQCIEFFPKE